MKFGASNIIAAGDLHGSFAHLLELQSELHESVIFQVGDFCAHGNGPCLPTGTRKFNAMLQSIGATMIVLRGNWDHPSLFGGESDFSNIRFVRDGSFITVGDIRCLCVGGAISHDRKTDRWQGWPDTAAPCPPPEGAPAADLLFTHSFPRKHLPSAMRSAGRALAAKQKDTALAADLQREDEALELWADSCVPSMGWIYGHYHKYIPSLNSLGLGFRQVAKIHSA